MSSNCNSFDDGDGDDAGNVWHRYVQSITINILVNPQLIEDKLMIIDYNID